jgi:hypothetical protein
VKLTMSFHLALRSRTSATRLRVTELNYREEKVPPSYEFDDCRV